MKLFLIDKIGCNRMMESLINGIKAVYEMEAIFNGHPDSHLDVDFLPEKYNIYKDPSRSEIILQAGNEIIRKSYNFDDPQSKEDLKTLIWKYLHKYNNVKDITKYGTENDFRGARFHKVITGWQNAKRARKRCPRKFKHFLANDGYANNIRDIITANIMKDVIRHWRYRVDTRDMQTRKICLKVRGEECGNNYPSNTPLFRRCMREVRWLCKNGYPRNKRTEIVTNYREKLKNDILKYLKQSNMKVNKGVLDVILSAGFFERVANRMGNKSQTLTYERSDRGNKYKGYGSVKHAVDNVMNDYDYYSKLIEGFDNEKSELKDKNYLLYIIITIIIIIVIYKLVRLNSKN